MKSKKISKKLKLNKKTIANLKNEEMKAAHGGNYGVMYFVYHIKMDKHR